MNPKDKRTAILQAFWRKAFKNGQVAIPLADEKMARKVRFDLYNSVKLAKANPLLDRELHDAANGCSLSFHDKKTILIKRTEVEHELLDAALLAGVKVSSVQPAATSQLDLEALESERRMKEKLAEVMNAPIPGHRKNPYYNREE